MRGPPEALMGQSKPCRDSRPRLSSRAKLDSLFLESAQPPVSKSPHPSETTPAPKH